MIVHLSNLSHLAGFLKSSSRVCRLSVAPSDPEGTSPDRRPHGVSSWQGRSNTVRTRARAAITHMVYHPANQPLAQVKQGSGRPQGHGVEAARNAAGMPCTIAYMVPEDYDAIAAYRPHWEKFLAGAQHEAVSVREIWDQKAADGLPACSQAIVESRRKVFDVELDAELRGFKLNAVTAQEAQIRRARRSLHRKLMAKYSGMLQGAHLHIQQDAIQALQALVDGGDEDALELLGELEDEAAAASGVCLKACLHMTVHRMTTCALEHVSLLHPPWQQ